MQLVADGNSTIDISNITGASPRTIENHIHKLKNKFKCKTLTHLGVTLLRGKIIK